MKKVKSVLKGFPGWGNTRPIGKTISPGVEYGYNGIFFINGIPGYCD